MRPNKRDERGRPKNSHLSPLQSPYYYHPRSQIEQSSRVDQEMMTSTAIYLNNHSAMDDGIAITNTGYLSPRSGLPTVESGATYDSRFGMASLDVQQQHSLEMNVSI